MKRARIDEIVEAIAEDRADASLMEELDALLRGDPAAQRHYLQQVDLLATLRWQATGEATRRTLAARNPLLPWWRTEGAKRALGAVAAVGLIVGTVLGIGAQPGAPIATVVDPAHRDLVAGSFQVAAGLSRLLFARGASITVEGPSDLEITGPASVTLRRGSLLGFVPPDARGFTVRAPGLEIVDRGTEFGVAVDAAGASEVTVFQGEVEVAVAAEVTGKIQRLRLTRDEGLRVEPGVGLTTHIVANNEVFARMREAADASRPLLANASFEYPATPGAAQRAAAGWTLDVFPRANVNAMMIGAAAGVLEGQRAHLGFLGATPVAPDGRQWGYLNAETLPDGRKYHTSMHQEAGPVRHDKVYRLSATLASQGEAGESYAIGLYLGTPADGPKQRLQVLEGGARTPERVSLEYRAPDTALFSDQILFVRIESIAPPSTGLRHVLVDDVKLEVRDR